MKKIMFRDDLGLTQAVLAGRKTMTRRIEDSLTTLVHNYFEYYRKPYEVTSQNWDDKKRMVCMWNPKSCSFAKPRYSVGEIVAIGQSYKSIYDEMMTGDYGDSMYDGFRNLYLVDHKGWENKMYVSPDVMPHQILITDVRAEQLQSISDLECMMEGIYKDENSRFIGTPFRVRFDYTFEGAVEKDGERQHWFTPRDAFSVLIDKVGKKGTWKRNPWVFAYTFERIR